MLDRFQINSVKQFFSVCTHTTSDGFSEHFKGNYNYFVIVTSVKHCIVRNQVFLCLISNLLWEIKKIVPIVYFIFTRPLSIVVGCIAIT